MQMRAWGLGLLLSCLVALPVSAEELPGFVRQLLAGSQQAAAPDLAGHHLVRAQAQGGTYRTVWRPLQPPAAPEVVIVLAPRPPDQPAFALTPSFRVSFELPHQPGQISQTPPEVQALTQAVRDAVAAHDPGQLVLPVAKASSHGLNQAQFRPEIQADRWLRLGTWGLLWLGLLALSVIVGASISELLELRKESPRIAVWLGAVLVLATLARALVPQRLVMAHMGHELLASAQQLTPPLKYGPAAQQWLHVWLQWTGGGWPAAVALNQACAVLQLPILAALLPKLGAQPRAVLLALLAVGLAPVLVHDAASESILVPAMTAVLAASWALVTHLRTGQRWPLLAAWTLGLVAMLARPELLALVPATAMVLWALTPPPRRFAWRWAVLGLLLATVVLALRWQQVTASLEVERQLGNTPRIFSNLTLTRAWHLLVKAYWRKNGLLWPEMVPAALWLGLGLGFCAMRRPLSQQTRLWLGLALLSAGYLLPTPLDLPWISVSRVQAPAMLWALAASGVALACWLDKAPRHRWITSSIAVLALASALWTVPLLWRVDLQTAEESALRQALALLPHAPATVLTRSHDDLPDERIHLGFPDSLLPPQVATGALADALSGAVQPGQDGLVYAWLGTRCYQRDCSAQGVHPACAAILKQFYLRPVWTGQVDVQHLDLPSAFGGGTDDPYRTKRDLDFPWCVQQSSIPLGLYALTPR